MRTVFLSVISTACSWVNSSNVPWRLEEEDVTFVELVAAPPRAPPDPSEYLSTPALFVRDSPRTMVVSRLSSPSISFLNNRGRIKAHLLSGMAHPKLYSLFQIILKICKFQGHVKTRTFMEFVQISKMKSFNI